MLQANKRSIEKYPRMLSKTRSIGLPPKMQRGVEDNVVEVVGVVVCSGMSKKDCVHVMGAQTITSTTL